MLFRNLRDCEEFIAGDGSILRELLHPDKTDLSLRYSLAHARVAAGTRTKSHRLKSSEVYYIISGRGLMHIDEATFEVGPDCAVNIPPESMQYIESTGDSDLIFLCIVDPAWQPSDEQVFDR